MDRKVSTEGACTRGNAFLGLSSAVSNFDTSFKTVSIYELTSPHGSITDSNVRISVYRWASFMDIHFEITASVQPHFDRPVTVLRLGLPKTIKAIDNTTFQTVCDVGFGSMSFETGIVQLEGSSMKIINPFCFKTYKPLHAVGSIVVIPGA